MRGFSGRAGRDVRRGPGPGVRGQRLGRGSGVCIPRVLRKGRGIRRHHLRLLPGVRAAVRHRGAGGAAPGGFFGEYRRLCGCAGHGVPGKPQRAHGPVPAAGGDRGAPSAGPGPPGGGGRGLCGFRRRECRLPAGPVRQSAGGGHLFQKPKPRGRAAGLCRGQPGAHLGPEHRQIQLQPL